MQRFQVKTGSRNQFVDVTRDIADILKKTGISDGACIVYVPHTTCGVTINENADPDVQADIISHLGRVIPRDRGFRHSEGNSDAHIKASLVGSSVNVPVSSGRLALGTWQSVFLCEFDGPRTRNLFIQVLAG